MYCWNSFEIVEQKTNTLRNETTYQGKNVIENAQQQQTFFTRITGLTVKHQKYIFFLVLRVNFVPI